MKSLTLLFVILFISSCVSIKSGGGYEFSGRVIDAKTKDPIQGASVNLKYSAIGFLGNNSKKSAILTTDIHGRFYEFTPRVTLSGGTGGLLGYVDKWPYIEYSKNGYNTAALILSEPSEKSYKDVVLKLERK